MVNVLAQFWSMALELPHAERPKKNPKWKTKNLRIKHPIVTWFPQLLSSGLSSNSTSLQKLLELINEFSKAAGYKINIQKSVVFLYTNNDILEKEYKNTIHFKISPPKIKYLGINLTKEVKDLYAEKTLIKEIKEDSENWKDIPGSWIGRINIV